MTDHLYPAAVWKPVAWANARNDSTNPSCVVLHVAASEANSLHHFFNGSKTACSHFYVRRDGTTEQYIRGDRLSAAEYQGSHRALSVETQGADADGVWTSAQVETLSRICAWAHRTYSIPLEKMGSSAYNEVGIGWHRLGIDGNFPDTPSPLAGRKQIGFGERWSGAFGKECPGDNRILQVDRIVQNAWKVSGVRYENASISTVRVDGVWGAETTRALQNALSTVVDGVISSQSAHMRHENPGLGSGWDWVRNPHGSRTIIALQKLISMRSTHLDGLIGPVTIRALQRWLGTTVDGFVSRESEMVFALQRRLNREPVSLPEVA